jgi:dihydrofolate reductase
MRITLIVAMAVNRVIGRAGTIPWRIPGEQQLFKRLTLGHAVIMGRKTYESIGRPLPERTNIVVSRQVDYTAPGCRVAPNLDAALRSCPTGESEAFICGGGQLYREAMPLAGRIYLTVLPRLIVGDTLFPKIPEKAFRLTEARTVIGVQPYHFFVYDRIRPGGESQEEP